MKITSFIIATICVVFLVFSDGTPIMNYGMLAILYILPIIEAIDKVCHKEFEPVIFYLAFIPIFNYLIFFEK